MAIIGLLYDLYHFLNYSCNKNHFFEFTKLYV